MKLYNILLYAIKQKEYEFLKYRHQIDSKVFSSFKSTTPVTHLKLHEPDFLPAAVENEIFFKGRNDFFYIPIKLLFFIYRQRPDVIIIHGFNFPFQLFCLFLVASRKSRIIVQHHAEKPFINSIKLWFQKITYPRANAYMFSSAELARPFLDVKIIKSEEKIHEVMEGSTLFRQKNKLLSRQLLNIPDEIIFLWVGRLDKNKDPITVLKALHIFKKCGYAFRLYMIYGTSELEENIKLFITENQLTDSVVLIGKIAHDRLENWFSAADFFVAASHYEGSGIALCEAMACGCIPVVSNIPSFRCMTKNGECGFLFEPGNAEHLSEVLRSTTQIDKKEFSKKVLIQFEKELSLSAIGSKIETVASSS